MAAAVEAVVGILPRLRLLSLPVVVVVARLGRNASMRLLILGRLNHIAWVLAERLARLARVLRVALADKAARHPSAGTS